MASYLWSEALSLPKLLNRICSIGVMQFLAKKAQGSPDQPRMMARVLFPAFFGLILVVHVVWEITADMPPVWDMAHHELKGWEYLRALQEGNFLEQFSQITTHFPPLYYVQEAIVLTLFSQTQFLALLSNLLGMFLLSYCTFGIAAFYMEREVAVWTGLVTLLFPFVAWTSRLSLLDGPMAGWVAAAGYCLLKSRWLEGRKWSLLFGLACAAGILTKWTFPVYLFLPLCYALVHSENRRKSLINLMSAAVLATPFVFFWYLPNLSLLANRYPTTNQTSLIPWQADPRHGEPGLATILGWIYYPRVLASYFLYFPLTIAWVWSAIYSVKNRQQIPHRLRFLWWWLMGGLLLLIFVTPKDPRFAIPLVSPLAVLLVYPWRNRRNWVLGIFALAFLQFLSVSFEFPFHPAKIALFERHDTDYQSVQQEWVMYQSYYFDVAGPPRRENWRHQEMVEAIGDSKAVGFVPDLAHFHAVALALHAFREGRSFEVKRIGDIAGSVQALSSLDFVVGKTGFQGISYTTRFNHKVYRQLQRQGWSPVKTWDLPDQSQALLWQNPEAPRRE
ncbi:glycosyltransferase family 39 protein [Acidobacteria bacterium AH-259-D05]|nr:glycosyltransferase family 39 protein [Acidobacteria bacterium AH-259-D05]